IRTISSAATYPPLGRPPSVFERLGQPLTTRQEAELSAPVAGLARIKTAARSAKSHAGASAYAFAVFTRSIERLRVSGARATVWGSRIRRSRERSVCKSLPVRFCLAKHSNETSALRLRGSRHPSRSDRPARVEPRGVRHRRGTKPDAGSR